MQESDAGASTEPEDVAESAEPADEPSADRGIHRPGNVRPSRWPVPPARPKNEEPPSSRTILKCRDASGGVTFTQGYCPPGSKQVDMSAGRVKPDLRLAAQILPPAAQRADVGGVRDAQRLAQEAAHQAAVCRASPCRCRAARECRPRRIRSVRCGMRHTSTSMATPPSADLHQPGTKRRPAGQRIEAVDRRSARGRDLPGAAFQQLLVQWQSRHVRAAHHHVDEARGRWCATVGRRQRQ